MLQTLPFPTKLSKLREGPNNWDPDLWFLQVICLKAENNFIVENLIPTAQSYLTIASLQLVHLQHTC